MLYRARMPAIPRRGVELARALPTFPLVFKFAYARIRARECSLRSLRCELIE